jgi:hypothetical protein
MDDSGGHVGGQLRTDDDVPQLERPGRIGRGRAVDRERQDVRADVAPAMFAVELANALGLDELDRQVPLLDAGGREREPAQLLDVADLQAVGSQLRADDLDLEQS